VRKAFHSNQETNLRFTDGKSSANFLAQFHLSTSSFNSHFNNTTEDFSHTVKHFAFTRCGEFNVFGMVDAQIAVVEGELLSGTVTS